MAWEDLLLDASYKGFALDCVSTDDGCDSAVAEHTYPYVDGADIENLGLGSWRTSMPVVFYGPDYESRLQEFLDLIRQPGSGEFIHPVFGSIPDVIALLRPGMIHHDADNPDFCTVTVEFVQSTPSVEFFSRSTTAQTAETASQHGTAATDEASNTLASLIDQLRAASPVSTFTALRTAMTLPFAQIAVAEGVVLSWLDVIDYPAAWAADVTALALGMVNMFEFAAGNAGTDWSAARENIDELSGYGTPPDAATQIMTDQVPTEAQAVAATALTIQIVAATTLGDAAALAIQSESETPTMSAENLESICNAARDSIVAAIAQARALYELERSRPIVEPLKNQALALIEASRAVIELRPPLIDRVVESPANMRLLAHLWYGDHERADELYRLNSGRSPIVESGEVLRAYAE